jgi:hypothetical protein
MLEVLFFASTPRWLWKFLCVGAGNNYVDDRSVDQSSQHKLINFGVFEYIMQDCRSRLNFASAVLDHERTNGEQVTDIGDARTFSYMFPMFVTGYFESPLN